MAQAMRTGQRPVQCIDINPIQRLLSEVSSRRGASSRGASHRTGAVRRQCGPRMARREEQHPSQGCARLRTARGWPVARAVQRGLASPWRLPTRHLSRVGKAKRDTGVPAPRKGQGRRSVGFRLFSSTVIVRRSYKTTRLNRAGINMFAEGDRPLSRDERLRRVVILCTLLCETSLIFEVRSDLLKVGVQVGRGEPVSLSLFRRQIFASLLLTMRWIFAFLSFVSCLSSVMVIITGAPFFLSPTCLFRTCWAS